jgi:hypothetical protein
MLGIAKYYQKSFSITWMMRIFRVTRVWIRRDIVGRRKKVTACSTNILTVVKNETRAASFINKIRKLIKFGGA